MPESIDRPAFHVTFKWPARDGAPEKMVNIYASTAIECQQRVIEATRALGFRLTFESPADLTVRDTSGVALRTQTAAPSADLPPEFKDQEPTPLKRRTPRELPPPAHHHDGIPICLSRSCSRSAEAMIESNYGGYFCPGDSATEEAGKCRQVFDHKGARRKPTRAEADAARQTRGA